MTRPTRTNCCWNAEKSWLRTLAGTLAAALVTMAANKIIQAIRSRRDDKE